MLDRLKRLTRDTAVYGAGHIATRLLTFLLLPYYSFRLTPPQYGELTLYFLFMAIAQAFFLCGLDAAYLRYFGLEKNPLRRRYVTGTAICAATLWSFLLALLILVAAPVIGRLVVSVPTHPEVTPKLIRLCAAILFFDTVATFPFLFLRGTMRPVLFAAVKLLNVTINIALNIWFLSGLRLGLAGVLWANVLASASTLAVLIPIILPEVKILVDRDLLRDLLRFGLPNIPTYLFVMIIELADRKLLELFRGLEEAGLYSAGYKLGMFMAVVTGAFRFAWQPFFLAHADEEDAPRLFARVLTYFLLITFFLFLVLTFFIGVLVKTPWPLVGHVLSPHYWPGLAVFPMILLAHIFDGIYANLMVGVYLKKLTAKLPFVTGLAAAFTILANLALIPTFGMIAAAWITLAAFALEVILLYFAIRRFYPIPYEWRRISTLVALAIALWGVSTLPAFHAPLPRLFLLAAFPILLYVFRFPDERERQSLNRLLRRA